jgi:hypothetical protein
MESPSIFRLLNRRQHIHALHLCQDNRHRHVGFESYLLLHRHLLLESFKQRWLSRLKITCLSDQSAIFCHFWKDTTLAKQHELHRTPHPSLRRKMVRVGSCGFKHSNRPALFARFGLTPNVEHVLLLLSEIFPDRIGRLPDASLLDQLSGHRRRQVGARSRSESFRGGRHLMWSVNHQALKNSFVPAKPSPVDAKLTIPSRALLLRTCGRLSLRPIKRRSSLSPCGSIFSIQTVTSILRNSPSPVHKPARSILL